MITKKLCKAVNLVFWGTVLGYVGLDFVGYALIVKALWDISKIEPSSALLRPLGIGLIVWRLFVWIVVLVTREFNGGMIGLIVNIFDLYFQYQLLTNMAGVAGRFQCSQEESLLHLRNVQAVIITTFIVMDLELWNGMNWIIPIAYLLAFVQLFVIIGICKELFGLKKELSKIFDMSNIVG